MMRFWRGRRQCYAVGTAVALMLLPGCLQLPSVLTPLEQPSKLQAAAPRVSGEVPSGRERLPVFESHGKATPPTQAAAQSDIVAQRGDITLNFVDTDIREIVRAVLG